MSGGSDQGGAGRRDSATVGRATMGAFERRLTWALALLVWVLLCLGYHDARIDDAFITYRYGQNLALGRGLVFNPGERLMASTSPGHALLSGVVYAVAGHGGLPTWMACMGCLAVALEALALHRLFRASGGMETAAWVGCAVALGLGRGAPYAPLETNLVMACCLWALVHARRGHWLGVAVLSACAGLLRPDSHLLIAALGLYGLWILRRRAVGPALTFLAICLPWYGFALAYFGTVIPQSAVRKFQTSDLASYAQHIASHVPTQAWPVGASPVASVACLAAVAIGLWALRAMGDRLLWLLPAWAVMHAGAYLYLRPFTTHGWHLHPLGMITGVLSVAGLALAITRAGGATTRFALRALLGALLSALALRTGVEAAGNHHAYWIGARDATYRSAAQYLAARAAPGDHVGAAEVGTLAYHSDLPMYDWAGLVTPDPEARPQDPPLRFAVLDPLYTHDFAYDLVPLRRFSAHGFSAFVYDLGFQNTLARRYASTPGVVVDRRRIPALVPAFVRYLQDAERARAPDAPGELPDGRPDLPQGFATPPPRGR